MDANNEEATNLFYTIFAGIAVLVGKIFMMLPRHTAKDTKDTKDDADMTSQWEEIAADYKESAKDNEGRADKLNVELNKVILELAESKGLVKSLQVTIERDLRLVEELRTKVCYDSNCSHKKG